MPECESYLLQAAASENPVELTRRAAALRHLLEPAEHSLPDAENTALNELFAAITLGGRGVVKADLDAETMEMLHTALSGLSQPKPAADGTRDTRPAALRRAEAFTELLRRYLNSGHSPTEGYERPHLSLLIRDEDLAAAGDDNENDTTADEAPTADTTADQAPTADTAPRPAADRPAVCFRAPTAGVDRPRPRMRLPRLQPSSRVDPSPPHSALDQRWHHRFSQGETSLNYPHGNWETAGPFGGSVCPHFR